MRQRQQRRRAACGVRRAAAATTAACGGGVRRRRRKEEEEKQVVVKYDSVAMDGVVMGCLCGYEQISLQKECTQFLHKVIRFLHKVS